jgi:small subunit ribosomal protein S9
MADDEDTPETPTEETPVAEGHAVPTEDATEIAGSAEDAPLEALQEAQEHAEEVVAEAAAEEILEEVVAEEIVAEAVEEVLAEEVVAEAEAEAESEEEFEEEESAPRVKPAVPGAHLEVDIVPEGVDPLGRGEARSAEYEDPYAIEGEESEQSGEGQGEQEETLSQPIATAAIDLASGARYRATGKRKTAVARVTLRPGSGSYLVNGRTLEDHFPRITQQRNIRQPLETVGYQERMDVVARLHGGGISAQAGALRHGVSRALLEADPNLRGELKRRGFLTRDSRAKERKKAGLKKARKKPQFSKR